MLLWVLDGEVDSEQTQIAGQHRRAWRARVEPAGPFVYWFDHHSRGETSNQILGRSVGDDPRLVLPHGGGDTFRNPLGGTGQIPDGESGPGMDLRRSAGLGGDRLDTSPQGGKRMATRFQGTNAQEVTRWGRLQPLPSLRRLRLQPTSRAIAEETTDCRQGRRSRRSVPTAARR